MILKRTFHRLNLETRQQTEGTTGTLFTELDWFKELNKWNSQQPLLWHYWQDAKQRLKDVEEQCK